MKKVISVFCVALAMIVTMMSFQNSTAVKKNALTENVILEEEALPAWLLALLGIEVDYVRGMRVNTGEDCTGRGMCELHVGGSGISQPVDNLLNQNHAKDHMYAGFDDLGNMFILVFNPSNPEWNGSTYIQDGDFVVPSELARKFNRNTYTVKKGNYSIERDGTGKWVAVRFVKN